MFTPLILMFAIAASEGSETKVPDSLVRAFMRRESFKTAYFEYDFDSQNSAIGHTPKYHYQVRFAGNDVQLNELGDDDGIRSHDPRTGLPQLGVMYSCSPSRLVRNDGGTTQWVIRDGELTLLAYPKPDLPVIGGRAPQALLDPRSAGLFLWASSECSPKQWIDTLNGYELQWSQRESDGMVIVSASVEGMAAGSGTTSVTEWTIDPSRDDAIVSIKRSIRKGGGPPKLIEEMKADYERIDGRWWPRRCVSNAEKGATEIFNFTRVEFDRKNHPKSLGPDDLGVPPGIRASRTVVDKNGARNHIMGYYAGHGSVVSSEDWQGELKDKTDLTALEVFTRNARAIGNGTFPRWWQDDKAGFGLTGVARDPDLWETYLRRWIIRHTFRTFKHGGPPGTPSKAEDHQLTPAQIESAWAILKDSRKLALPFVVRIKQNATAEAKPIGVQAGKPDQKISSQGNEQSGPASHRPYSREELEIEHIFEKLKTRLETLLTTEQQNTEKPRKPK